MSFGVKIIFSSKIALQRALRSMLMLVPILDGRWRCQTLVPKTTARGRLIKRLSLPVEGATGEEQSIRVHILDEQMGFFPSNTRKSSVAALQLQVLMEVTFMSKTKNRLQMERGTARPLPDAGITAVKFEGSFLVSYS